MSHHVMGPVRRLETERGSFAYVTEGAGEPVLFIHGSLGTLHDFSRQVLPFSATHRVIAYSRRFHPPNPGPGEEELYMIDRHVDDCVAVLAGLRATPAHLVGASWGGNVALAVVLRAPDLATSLVLMEPPILPLLQRSPAGRVLAEQFQRETIGPSRAAFARGDREEGVRRFVDGIAGNRGSYDAFPPKARERLLALAPELGLELATPPEMYMPLPDPGALTRVTTPVLLVQGERSPKLFHLILNELELLLPDTERVTVPRSGHSVQIENAHHVNALLGQFFGTHRRS